MANNVVIIIEFGLTLPASILIFNIVKGISCIDEIFITKQKQKSKEQKKNWVASQQALSFNAPS